MEYKVIYGESPSELTTKVNMYIGEGFEPIGSHQVVVVREQNRYSGTQHMDTLNKLEYSQTLIKRN